MAVTNMSSSVFTIISRNAGGSNTEVIAGSVSGYAITFGTAVNYGSGSISFFDIIALDSTTFVVALGSATPEVCVGTLSGTTITLNSTYSYTAQTDANYPGLTVLSTTSFAIFFRAGGASSYYGVARVGTVSGSTVTFDSITTFNAGNTSNSTCGCTLTANLVVAACIDTSNSNYVTSVAGTIPPAGKLINAVSYVK
jgi:hypothetical protein